MTQTGSPLDSWLLTIVLATLAISLPILAVLAMRFLWERKVSLGRSKELEKLIWQLHRVASAMEHQMNLSFPAVQPGTEEASDIAFLQQPAAPVKVATRSATAQNAPAAVAQVAAAQTQAGVQQPAAQQPVAQQPVAQQPAAAEQGAEETGFKPLVPRDPKEPPRHGGVNSMFGF
jgi:hypothetical protein